MSTNTTVMAEAVRAAYRWGEEDETLLPLVLTDNTGKPIGRIKDGDAVIFYNIRGERESELTRAFVDPNFPFFPTIRFNGLSFATMIQYDPSLAVHVAFPPEGEVRGTLGEAISQRGLRQVKITEAEKAVHVGFFLNGKRTAPFDGEERIIVPTRKDVTLFDEAPEMSIDLIVGAAKEKIAALDWDFMFVNLPNVDVVGHIENDAAVMKAVEAVDTAAGEIVAAALRAGVTVIVTADHGTVEKWLYPDGTIDTGHTDSPVPFILISPRGGLQLRPTGTLTDVAPTVLALLGITKPELMTGTSLIIGHPERQERVLLLLLDGWGYGEEGKGNLISQARTPVMDRLWSQYPRSVLEASGERVGLPPGTVGNSEAGHLHIGAGRVVYSDRVRIDRAITDGTFPQNPVFLYVMDRAKARGQALHLMGIVSFFSSHGSLHHLYALLETARAAGMREVYIHTMLGRRGELPESGARYIEQVEKHCQTMGLGRVVSVIGRYWSMDREENWDRIEKTYRMLVHGEGRPVIAPLPP
ncbi:MAG: alkaline phosphatase family protein [Syntrophales bacterium]|nr:alkaline phosphatase family protein [Syntrophales bacterium]